MRSSNSEKEIQRRKIKEDIKKFLEGGGEIQQIPNGFSTSVIGRITKVVDEPETDEEKGK